MGCEFVLRVTLLALLAAAAQGEGEVQSEYKEKLDLESKVLESITEKDDSPYERKMKELVAEYIVATAVDSTNKLEASRDNAGRSLYGRLPPGLSGLPPDHLGPLYPHASYGGYGNSEEEDSNERTRPPRTRRPGQHNNQPDSSEEVGTITTTPQQGVYIQPGSPTQPGSPYDTELQQQQQTLSQYLTQKQQQELFNITQKLNALVAELPLPTRRQVLGALGLGVLGLGAISIIQAQRRTTTPSPVGDYFNPEVLLQYQQPDQLLQYQQLLTSQQATPAPAQVAFLQANTSVPISTLNAAGSRPSQYNQVNQELVNQTDQLIQLLYQEPDLLLPFQHQQPLTPQQATTAPVPSNGQALGALGLGEINLGQAETGTTPPEVDQQLANQTDLLIPYQQPLTSQQTTTAPAPSNGHVLGALGLGEINVDQTERVTTPPEVNQQLGNQTDIVIPYQQPLTPQQTSPAPAPPSGQVLGGLGETSVAQPAVDQQLFNPTDLLLQFQYQQPDLLIQYQQPLGPQQATPDLLIQYQQQPLTPQQATAAPVPPQIVYLQANGSIVTVRPRPSPQHVYNQVNNILDNVSRVNVTGIVDQALGIRAPIPTRNLVNGILNTVFCTPINRLLGRCRG